MVPQKGGQLQAATKAVSFRFALYNEVFGQKANFDEWQSELSKANKR